MIVIHSTEYHWVYTNTVLTLEYTEDALWKVTVCNMKQNFPLSKTFITWNYFLVPELTLLTLSTILAGRPLLSLCSKTHEHHKPTNPEQKHEPIDMPPDPFLFASISTSREATGELSRIISTCYSVLYYGLALRLCWPAAKRWALCGSAVVSIFHWSYSNTCSVLCTYAPTEY